MDISYSNGEIIKDCVIQVWGDLHNERSGYFRAFWTATPDATSGSPVIGYCSPGGSHKTIRAVVAEVRRIYPKGRCYRNGREVYPLQHDQRAEDEKNYNAMIGASLRGRV